MIGNFHVKILDYDSVTHVLVKSNSYFYNSVETKQLQKLFIFSSEVRTSEVRVTDGTVHCYFTYVVKMFNTYTFSQNNLQVENV